VGVGEIGRLTLSGFKTLEQSSISQRSRFQQELSKPRARNARCRFVGPQSSV